MKELFSDSLKGKLWLSLKEVNPVFRTIQSSSEMWDYPLSIANEIDNSILENVDVIYQIIEKEKATKTRKLLANPVVLEYHLLFARLYCLIYYMHNGETLYELSVLKPLFNEMGAFGKEWYDDMIKVLDGILEIDLQIKVAKEEAENINRKPIFELPVIKSLGERDQLFKQFNEESLFRVMAPIIRFTWRDSRCDEVHIWLSAKYYFQILWSLQYPETYIDIIKQSIIRKGNLPLCAYFLCLSKCLISIIYINNDPENLKKLREGLIKESRLNSSDLSVIINNINDNHVINDYDYIGNKAPEFNSNSEVEVVKKTYDSILSKIRINLENEKKQHEEDNKKFSEEIKRLSDMNTELNEKIVLLENEMNDENVIFDAPEDSDIKNNLRIEVFYHLIDLAQIDLNKRGRKTNAAHLCSLLSGIPLQQCKNYLSDRKLDEKEHKEGIEYVQKLFDALNIEWNPEIS